MTIVREPGAGAPGTALPDETSLFRSIFERAFDGIAIIAPDGTYIDQNEAHARLLGWSIDELRGATPALHLGDDVFGTIRGRLAADGYFFGVVESRGRDGSVRTLEMSAFAVVDGGGSVVAYVGVKRDISQRVAAERELKRQFEQLQAIHRMTTTLGRATDLQQIFDEGLDSVCRALHAPRAAILLVDADGVMRFRAWRGLSETYRQAVEGHSPWDAADGTPGPVIVRDVTNDPVVAELRPALAAEGIHALAFVPLLATSGLLGRFVVYFDTPRAMTHEELRLAETLADHLAFAIVRTRAQEALARREREFATLAEYAPDIIARFDRELRHLYVNPAVEAATGRPRSDFIGRTIREIGIAQAQAQQWTDLLNGVVETGRPAEREFSLAVPAGVRYYHSRVTPEVVVHGRVETVLAVTRDITEIKLTEERQRLLAEVGGILVAQLDRDDALHAVAHAIAASPFADQCGIELNWADDALRRYDAGPHTNAGAVMTAPLIARGRPIGRLALRSADPRRRYDADDALFADQLAGRIALAVDNLRLLDDATAASRAKSEFLATMSHELRTPLNAIMGYTDLLDMQVAGPLSPAQHDQISRIRASTTHLLTVIEQILTFSRAEAGREEVDNEELDVIAIAAECAAMVEQAAAMKGLTFSTALPEAPLLIRSDAVKLRQILLNVLGNAVKFTDAGGISMRVDVVEPEVVVEVVDTGVGIAAEHIERIFEPFWQVHRGATRRMGGTGLGLSVSRHLAQMLGGSLTVRSEVDAGSAFRLVLPLV